MIAAILDTNVILQSLISEAASASVRVVERYFDGDFSLVFSEATLDELITVLSLDRLKAKHGFSDDEILEYVNSLLDHGQRFTVNLHVSAKLTRDITDTKFLALAEVAQADYLVTNDGRHLLPLRSHGRTKIVTPGQFLLELERDQ